MFYYRAIVRGCGIACANALYSGCADVCPLRDTYAPGRCAPRLWRESAVVLRFVNLWATLWATPRELALAKVKNASVFRTTR